MQYDERLRIWIEQGNVNISQLFFRNYKSLGIKDLDAMLIMHMTAYVSEHEIIFQLPPILQVGWI